MLNKIIAQFLIVFCVLTNISYGDEDPYKFENIQVNEVATNARKAKEKAIAYAERMAFDRMIAKFVENFDSSRISGDDIASLVQSVQFNQEEITNRRYKALIDIYFNPIQTKFFIKNSVLDQTKKKLSLLVIPILNENGFVKLWGVNNPWLEKWQREKSNILNIVVPTGDLDDIKYIKFNEFDIITKSKIHELNTIYDTRKIMIAELRYNYNLIDDDIELKVFLKEVGSDTEATQQETLVASSKGEKDDNLKLHMDYLIEKVVNNLETAWIDYHANYSDDKRQLFYIRVKNMEDWLEIKNKLNSLNIIKHYKVEAFSARYTKVSIEFIKESLETIEIMKELGFKSKSEGNNIILQIK